MASPRTKQNQTLIDLVKLYQENLSGGIEAFATLLMRYQVEHKKEWLKLDEVKTCLSIAITEGLDPIVEHLLASGFPAKTLLKDPEIATNPDKRKEKSLLYFAAKGGHFYLVRLLVEKFRVDPKDKMGMDGAILGGHTKIAQYFIKKGASVNEFINGYESTSFASEYMQLPYLTIAALQQNHNMIELLVDTGAKIGDALACADQYFRRDKSDHEEYRTILQTIMDYAHGYNFQKYTSSNSYPYFSNVSLAKVNMMGVSFDGKCATRELLQQNQFIDAQQALLTDEDVKKLKHKKQQARLTKNLSSAVKQYGELKTSDGIYNMVPLHIAAMGDLEAVKTRLAAGVNPQSVKNSEAIKSVPKAPILAAVEARQTEIVKLLAVHPGIDPASLYETTKIALKNNHNELAKGLLLLPNLPALDKHWKTLLHHAASFGNTEMVQWMHINLKMDLNQLDIEKRSALFYAASERHKGTIDYFLQSDADINLKDTYGRSIIDFMYRTFEDLKYDSYVHGGYKVLDLDEMEKTVKEIEQLIKSKNLAKKSPLITQRQQWMSSTQENAVLDNAADLSSQEKKKGMRIA